MERYVNGMVIAGPSSFDHDSHTNDSEAFRLTLSQDKVRKGMVPAPETARPIPDNSEEMELINVDTYYAGVAPSSGQQRFIPENRYYNMAAAQDMSSDVKPF